MDTALCTGIGLCAVAALRCAGAVARWIGERRRERREFLKSLSGFERQLEQLTPKNSTIAPPAWKGYRRFVVQRTIEEAEGIRSIYLAPEDRRPLPAYPPGQFITLRVPLPGANQPAVRCYSLSDRPLASHYRITVKDAAGGPPNSVSRHLHRSIHPGDVLESQPPRGDFYLREDDRPAVLIAAGIGITPLLSMAATLLHTHADRRVILFYGVRNSREHAFRQTLATFAGSDRLLYVPCYSQPLAHDRSPQDFVVPGRATPELVRRMLPDGDFPFYVCGPSAFMETMIAGLRDWGVAERDLHFEAFGPSTVKRTLPSSTDSASPNVARVLFQQSGLAADWPPGESLLNVAAASGVSLPSGCRSGNCGMCAARLLAGSVKYAEPPTAPLDPGFCLACVAQPDSAEVTFDA
jgi:ferredoxin-NADP reductase